MHAIVNGLARAFAFLGGLVLSALVVMTCLSIAGRSLNGALHSDALSELAPGLAAGLLGLGIGPIPGDFEIVEAGMAFAVFAFLPLCQLVGAHASVDVFTQALPPRADRVLRAAIEIAFAAVLVLVAWQLFEGMESKRRSGQTTLLLQYPVWWAYALSLSGAVAAALVSLYVAAMRLVEAATGRPVLPPDAEAGH